MAAPPVRHLPARHPPPAPPADRARHARRGQRPRNRRPPLDPDGETRARPLIAGGPPRDHHLMPAGEPVPDPFPPADAVPGPTVLLRDFRATPVLTPRHGSRSL